MAANTTAGTTAAAAPLLDVPNRRIETGVCRQRRRAGGRRLMSSACWRARCGPGRQNVLNTKQTLKSYKGIACLRGMWSLAAIAARRRHGHRACTNTTTSLIFVLAGCLLASEEVNGCDWMDRYATHSKIAVRAPESFHLSWVTPACNSSDPTIVAETITGYVLQPVVFRSFNIDACV